MTQAACGHHVLDIIRKSVADKWGGLLWDAAEPDLADDDPSARPPRRLAQAEPLNQLMQFGAYVDTGELHQITRYIAGNAVRSGLLRS